MKNNRSYLKKYLTYSLQFLLAFELMMFLEEHDPSDKQGFINFLTPYYEKAKQLAKHNA